MTKKVSPCGFREQRLDVTERMQAEEKLRKNKEGKYRHLVENAYYIVSSMDRNGYVTLWTLPVYYILDILGTNS